MFRKHTESLDCKDNVQSLLQNIIKFKSVRTQNTTHNHQLQYRRSVGPIAQLVDHCTGIAEIGVEIPVQARIFLAFFPTAKVAPKTARIIHIISIHSSNTWNSCINKTYVYIDRSMQNAVRCCSPDEVWLSPSLSDLAFTMAAADTREAIEFSVGLRKDGEPEKDTK